MRLLIAFLLFSFATGTAALAKPPLREVAAIDDAVMAVAIADEIRKSCDGISPRLIRAYSALNNLKAMAQARGYSAEEVEAYVTSKDEKARMKAKAEAFLQSNGVSPGDRSALCAFGRDQISAQSEIGKLLR